MPYLAALLGVTAAGSVLAIGSVHVSVLLVVAVVAAVAGVFGVRRGVASGTVLPPPAVVTLLLAAYSAFQAVPLPASWLKWAAPHNAALWARVGELLGNGAPAFASIALDPSAALVESLKWLTYASVFIAAAVVGRQRGILWIAQLVFGCAVVTGTVTILHGLFGLRRVYGLYAATFEPYRWSVGPLLNTNNLAGYLNLGVFCGIGLLMSRGGRLSKPVVGFGITTLIGVSFVSASRAGVAALVLGAVLLWIASADRTGEANDGAPPATRGRRALFAGVLGGGALLALLGSSAGTWRELLDDRFDKLRLLTDVRRLVADHPWLGIGRGSFESVFPAYGATQRNLSYAHAENFISDWSAEWGIPVALLALAAYAWTLRPSALRARKSFLSTSILTASLAVVAQNVFDLALEVPGVVIALATLLGGAWGHAHAGGEDTPTGRNVRRHRVSAGWVLAAASVTMLGLVVMVGRHPTGTDRRILAGQFRRADLTDQSQREALSRVIAGSIRKHPADPYYPRLAAYVAWKGSKNPMPWLQYALERDMDKGQTHLLVAQVLVSRQAWSQALLELKLAVAHDSSLAPSVARLATALSHDDTVLLRAAPDGSAGAPVLTQMASRLAPAAGRYRLLREAIQRDPGFVQARQRLSSDVLAAIDGNEEPCNGSQRADCEREVTSQIRAINAAGDVEAAAKLGAGLLMSRGQFDQAERLLAEHCPTAVRRVACLTLQVKAALRAGGTEERLNAAVDALVTAACVTPAECAGTCGWLGGVLGGQNRWDAATRFFERAAGEQPSAAAWLRVSNAATLAGQHARAAAALEKAARLGAPGADQLLGQERKHMVREALAR